MKYVLIFAVVVLLVRIDMVIDLVEKAINKIPKKQPMVESSQTASEVVKYSDDQSLKRTPRDRIFSLIETFHVTPDEALRKRIVEQIKSDPKIFGEKLDKALEASLFSCRDLLIQGNPEVVALSMDLQGALRGENKEIPRRFFSLLMDMNLDLFMQYYVKTFDAQCTLATVFGDDLPEDERYYQLLEREKDFSALVNKEGLSTTIKFLGDKCLEVIRQKISTLPPPATSEALQVPQEPQPEPGPVAIPAPINPDSGTP